MRALVVISCLLLTNFGTYAFSDSFDYSLDKSMTFKLAGTGGNCNTCNWIVAEGTIEVDTPQQFNEFILAEQKNGGFPQFLHINSPGGRLFPAVELGELIRKFELTVLVAKTVGEQREGGNYIDDRMTKRDPAICASACVVAFAGGNKRLAISDHYSNAIAVQPGRMFLVHQFYASDALVDPVKKQFSGLDRSSDQVASGIILEYFNRMGISSKLFQLMSSVPPNGRMLELSDSQLVEVGIENVLIPATIELAVVGKDAIGVEVTRNTYSSAMITLITCDAKRRPVFETMITTSDKQNADSLREWGMYGDMILKTEAASIVLTASDLRVTEQKNGSLIAITHVGLKSEIEELVGRKAFDFEAIEGNRYSSEAAWELSFKLPSEFRGVHVLSRACSR